MKSDPSNQRDPADLRPHPILHHIPAPAKDAPEVFACADAIREQDYLQPLIITEAGEILTDDSRLRWMAARRMGLELVPVIVQPAELAPVIALNALVHRAHYTKSAIAYLAVPLLKPAFDAAKAARLENLRKGHNSPKVHSVHYRETAEDFAEANGICRRLLFNAKAVRAEFERDRKVYTFEVDGGPEDGAKIEQTLKEHFEPKILRQQVDSEHQAQRPIGLGGVMKAIGSIRQTKGAPKITDPQLELFTGGFSALRKRFVYWQNFSAEERRAADPAIEQFLEAMPDDLLERFESKLRARRKRTSP
jgi:ParB-like chromosome segregation protein Spo0J